MHYALMLLVASLASLAIIEQADAAVYIPEGEYKGYYNSGGFYTIVGKVVSTEYKPVKPTIHVVVRDENTIIEKSIEWAPILNVPSLSREIPFKIILPEVKGSNATIDDIYVTFKHLDREPIAVMALYDNSLIMFDDHITGRVINLGNETVYNIRVYAGAHGMDGSWLDTSISQEVIDELRPNESKPFTLYIDPVFKGQVGYYSCFAPSDPFIMNLTTTRNGEPFEVYAESIVWFYNSTFDEESNTFFLDATNNSIALPQIVSLRLPLSSMDERFQVYLDGREVNTLQSIEEDNMSWHLSFEYPPSSFINEIKITNFGEPQYKYSKFYTDNDIKILVQMPRYIMPMQESSIRLAFYNATNDRLIKDVNYNIELVDDGRVILDLDRNAINGIDAITHLFESEGTIDMKLDILDESIRSSIETSIVVVPEFPISILIIAISMLSMLAIRYRIK